MSKEEEESGRMQMDLDDIPTQWMSSVEVREKRESLCQSHGIMRWNHRPSDLSVRDQTPLLLKTHLSAAPGQGLLSLITLGNPPPPAPQGTPQVLSMPSCIITGK